MTLDRAVRKSSRRLPVLARAVMSLVVLASLMSCSDNTFDVESAEVDGSGTLGLRDVSEPVKAIVVYFHGSDQVAQVIYNSEKNQQFFAPLLRGGFAVVAADAGKNAYGNSASRQDYRSLMTSAEAKYGAKVQLFVAESMGALAALALLAEDAAHQIKGMVGITPLMGLPAYIRGTSFIADQWNGKVTNEADPLSWPPNTFVGRNFRLYQAAQDVTIPRAATATDFANRFASVATVDVVECRGAHVDPSCYQGDDVEKWFAGLG